MKLTARSEKELRGPAIKLGDVKEAILFLEQEGAPESANFGIAADGATVVVAAEWEPSA